MAIESLREFWGRRAVSLPKVDEISQASAPAAEPQPLGVLPGLKPCKLPLRRFQEKPNCLEKKKKSFNSVFYTSVVSFKHVDLLGTANGRAVPSAQQV